MSVLGLELVFKSKLCAIMVCKKRNEFLNLSQSNTAFDA